MMQKYRKGEPKRLAENRRRAESRKKKNESNFDNIRVRGNTK